MWYNADRSMLYTDNEKMFRDAQVIEHTDQEYKIGRRGTILTFS